MLTYTGPKAIMTAGGTHDSTKTYEALTVVFDSVSGNSYVSKIDVPVGVSLDNTTYWQISANPNEAVAELIDDVADLQDDVGDLQTAVAGKIDASVVVDNAQDLEDLTETGHLADALLVKDVYLRGADDIDYDNTASGLVADDVQDAIDEVNGKIGNKMSYADNAVLGAKNLFPNKATSQTVSGITVTVNADKTMVVNGTATATPVGIEINGNVSLDSGRRYKIYGLPANATNCALKVRVNDVTAVEAVAGEEAEFDYNGGTIIVDLMIRNKPTLTNVTVSPIITLATDTDDTYVPYAMTNRELTEKVNDLHYYGILNGLAIPSFTNGTRLQQMTILEIFTALPLESQDGIYVGSEINIPTYNGTNILFDNIKSVTKLGSLGAGMLNIQKFESARGIVTYRLDNKIFQCTILNSALTTCYSSTLTAV